MTQLPTTLEKQSAHQGWLTYFLEEKKLSLDYPVGVTIDEISTEDRETINFTGQLADLPDGSRGPWPVFSFQ
jgi:hypothetical protein